MITNPYIAEFIGTAILLFLGNGIVANVSLNKTKASKQGKVRMTGIKTRAQNVRSRRLQTINRPTNRKRGGRI